MEPSTDIEKFQKLLSESKNIIAVAGAGLSAASGYLPLIPSMFDH
jgi:NAD-dependent SIR2 family protein deacetylase